MAEICRVLLVTLLLCLFWLPSGTDVGSILEGMPHYDPGDLKILNLLATYFIRGCKGVGKEDENETNDVGTTQGPGYSTGQRYIINLLSSYFSSGCRVIADEVGDMQGLNYSTGEKHIIKLLSSYFSTGCKAATAIEDEAKAAGIKLNPAYSTGETQIIKVLAAVVSSQCRKLDEKDLRKSGEGTGTTPRSGATGRHAQSVVLELFLLIFGVCLTRIEFEPSALSSEVKCMI